MNRSLSHQSTLGQVIARRVPLAVAFALASTTFSVTTQTHAQGYGSTQASRSTPAGLTMDYEGFTEPRYDVLVAASEIGRLEDVHVRVGQRVGTGEVIAQLEDGLQVEAVATAKFRANMRGELEAAKAEVQMLEMRVEQYKTLTEQNAAVPDEYRRAIADWEIAKAKLLSANEQISLRELEQQRFELQLDRRRVRAPMAGVVAEVFHHPGEYITPADPAVIRLLNVDQLLGVFNIAIEEMDGVEVGNLATVYIMSLQKTVTGKVAEVTPEIDGESGTVKVKVLLDNQDGSMQAGDRCQMTVERSRSASREKDATKTSNGMRRLSRQPNSQGANVR